MSLSTLNYLCISLCDSQYTNWQSRTAIAIMPALFVFTLTSEMKMVHRMEEVAGETEHAIKSVEWADQKQRQDENVSVKRQEVRLLYREAVLNSGLRLVEGDHLSTSHKAANYVQANPFKCIIGVGAPAVALIFYGRNTKEHRKSPYSLLATIKTV